MKWLFILIIITIVTTPSILAEPSFCISEKSNYSFKWSCENGGVCSSSSSCNVSINYPNSTILVDQGQGTNLNNGFFNYTLDQNQTTPRGEYSYRIDCFDGGVNDTITGTYEVNLGGICSNEQRTDTLGVSVWFIFGLATLLFISFLFIKESLPTKLTFLLFSVILFLVALNILFINLQDQIVNPTLETFFDGFIAVSWYFYFFLFSLLILLWLFTIINTVLLRKNLQNAKKFGNASFNV